MKVEEFKKYILEVADEKVWLEIMENTVSAFHGIGLPAELIEDRHRPEEVLKELFVWGATPQGQVFWSSVYNKLEKANTKEVITHLNSLEKLEATVQTDSRWETLEEGLPRSLVGLTGEVGELADAVKRWQYYGQDLDTEKVLEECGDILFYLASALWSAGQFTLGHAAQHTMQKYQTRFPNGWNQEDAIKKRGFNENLQERCTRSFGD